MVLSPLGYLGLGVASPAQRLDLLGNVRIEGAAGATREIQFTTGATSERWAEDHDEQARRRRRNTGSDLAIKNYER